MAALLSTTPGLPHGLHGQSLAIQLLIIGEAALPLGLLLSGLHAHVVRTFSGEATARRQVEKELVRSSCRAIPRYPGREVMHQPSRGQRVGAGSAASAGRCLF